MKDMSDIKMHLADILRDIRDYEITYSRKPFSVSLLAVSKNQSIEKIKEALAVGQKSFGENYLQEALIKISALADQKIEWHFIGPIQSNKIKKISEHFSWVQSVTNSVIAKKLNDSRPSHLSPLNVCLQVNISQEQTKAGATPKEVMSLAEDISSLPRLTLRGLMAIPAPFVSAEQNNDFHKMRVLFEELLKKFPSIDTLSMGMSDDLAVAIAEGSTMVRIGTKIFGQR
jgi:pyridoxal phosphate enzyme (YggS family)